MLDGIDPADHHHRGHPPQRAAVRGTGGGRLSMSYAPFSFRRTDRLIDARQHGAEDGAIERAMSPGPAAH